MYIHFYIYTYRGLEARRRAGVFLECRDRQTTPREAARQPLGQVEEPSKGSGFNVDGLWGVDSVKPFHQYFL